MEDASALATGDASALDRIKDAGALGQIENASVLAEPIGRDIKKYGKTHFQKLEEPICEAVRQLTGKHHDATVVDMVNAESLNDQSAAISNDLRYIPPLGEISASASE